MSIMKNLGVSFNLENEQEKRLYEYARSWGKGRFSSRIKKLIEEDMVRYSKPKGIQFTLEQGKHHMKKP